MIFDFLNFSAINYLAVKKDLTYKLKNKVLTFKDMNDSYGLRKYNIEKLNFVEINTFEILKLADKYKCIRRNFEINDYLLEQKTLEQSAFLDFIDNTYYEGVNSLGRKVYFVKDKKKCSPAIKAIKRASN